MKALIIIGLIGTAVLAGAAAAGSRDHDLARDAVRSGAALPLADILDKVRPKLQGEVVRVELEREHGRFVYEFRVIGTDGRLRDVHVDAATAEVMNEERK